MDRDNILRSVPAPGPHSAAELRALLDTITRFRQVLWREERHIVFWGTFKSGKSTLINALLGSEVLPMRVLRATGTTTCIHYAPQPCANVVYGSDKNADAQVQPVPFDERARYILLDLERSGATLHGAHGEVQIGLPLPLLRQQCILVDTPGLMDDTLLTRRTYQALGQADLAVMVLSAYQLLSHREKDAARMVQSMCSGNIAFIINQIDLIAADERDAVLERAHAILQGVGSVLIGQPRIFATDALTALEARKRGIQPSDDPNGVLAFEQWLTRLLDNPAWQASVWLSRLTTLEKHVTRLSSYIADYLPALEAARDELAQAEATTHARQHAQLQEAVAEDRLRLTMIKSRLDWHSEMFVKACVAHAERIIDSDEQWHINITNSFSQGVEEYARNIERGVCAALTRTGVQPPAFTFAQDETHPARTTYQAWLNGASLWVDLMPDGPLAQQQEFADVPVLDVLEAAFGQVLLSIKPAIIDAVVQTAHQVVPALRQAAAQHIDQVEALLNSLETTHQHRPPDSPRLTAAHRMVDEYQHIASWCDQVLQAIADAKRCECSY